MAGLGIGLWAVSYELVVLWQARDDDENNNTE